MDILITITFLLLCGSVFGYIFSVIKEGFHLINKEVEIKSNKVTQKLIDELDYKVFRLGKTKLSIGDEIKIYLINKTLLKGVVVGAKKNNELYIVTSDDRVVELKISMIKKLKIVTRYGRLF